MFYGLIDENKNIAEKYHSDTQVSKTDLWAELESISNKLEKFRSCPACGKPISNYLWGPIRTAKLSNTRFPDIIYLGGDDLVVSEQFKNEFEHEEFKGIIAFEEIVISGRNNPMFKYYNTQIVYSDIPWKFRCFSTHSLRFNSDCRVCGRIIERARGLVFSENTLKQYDIFQLYNLPHTYWLSERMAEWVSKCNFKNALFMPAYSYNIG